MDTIDKPDTHDASTLLRHLNDSVWMQAVEAARIELASAPVGLGTATEGELRGWWSRVRWGR